MIYVTYLTCIQLMVLGMVYCAYRSFKEKTEIGTRIGRMEILASCMLYAACFFLMTQKEWLAYVFRAVFFVCSDYLAVSLYRYVVCYTEYSFKDRIYAMILHILIVVDNISMVVNVWTHHAFTFEHMPSYYGRTFLKIEPNGLYVLFHYFIFYFLLMVAIVSLAWKILHVASFYRKKYSFILLNFVGAIVINMIFFTMNLTLDYSLLAFGIMGIAIWYYSLYYMPNGLLERTLSLVIKDMNSGIVCFDINGKCVYVNDLAVDVLQIKNNKKMLEERYFLWKEHLKDAEQIQWQEEWIVGDKEHSFELSYQKLLDTKGHNIGTYCEIQDRTEEIETFEREHYKATHDELTGLYNRSYFFDRTKEILSCHPEETYLMVCSDIHDFKLVNDLFGIERGNEVLKKEAEMLVRYAGFLSRDVAIFGRLFGDKFALCIQKNALDVEYLTRKMDHLRKIFSNTEFHMHIYVGIYEIIDIYEDPAIMCDKASIAIETLRGDYTQKVAYYDDTLIKRSMQEKKLVSEFDRAIQQKEFVFFLQPQADTEGKVAGGEALVRWQHPDMGLLFPGSFISIFEKTGLIYRLDQFIWDAAAHQLAIWKEQGLEQYYISVNISPMDFYYLNIYDIFTSLVEKYQINVRNFKLEITETAIMSDVDKNLDIIKKLQEYGFLIEMDDFGSGYSSLNTLKDIPADVLKIDMGFLRETTQIERSRYILKSIISLAEMLGMDVITEGVETKEQVDMLSEMGCHLFQGYYFSKPIPLEEFETKYIEM